MIIYTQIHMLYNSKTIKFDLITHNAINEKRYILAIKKDDIIMLAHCNNKDKQFVKGDFNDFDFINREIYAFCKIIDHKFKYFFVKC